MANDLDFLNRQCSALRNKYGTIDLTTNINMYSQTALQMSIYKDGERCTSLLLRHGADPRLQDDEGKSFFHTAAEVSPEHLTIALEYCRENARQILKDDEELWEEKMEELSDKELAQILLDNICSMCDNQGYTPLMLASKQGNPSSARLLVQASAHTVNMPMPNCGSTALYLAVAAACMEATNSSNHTKVPENFLKTIEILVENGADPSIENHSGSSVNTLLMEYHRADLSVLIANNLTKVKRFTEKDLNSYMLVKNGDGNLNVAEIWAKTKIRKEDNTSKENPNKASGKCASTETSKIASNRIKSGKIASFTIKSGKNASVGKKGAVKKTLTVYKMKLQDVTRKDTPKYVKILPKPTQVKDTKGKKINLNIGKINDDKATKRRNETAKKVNTKRMKVSNEANTSTSTGDT